MQIFKFALSIIFNLSHRGSIVFQVVVFQFFQSDNLLAQHFDRNFFIVSNLLMLILPCFCLLDSKLELLFEGFDPVIKVFNFIFVGLLDLVKITIQL